MKALLEEPQAKPKSLKLYFGSIAVFLSVVTVLVVEFTNGRLPFDTRFVAAALCLNGFLAVLLLLAHRDVQIWLAAQVAKSAGNVWLFLLPVLLLYLLYTLGTESFQPLPCLKLVAYVFLPAALLLTIRQMEQRLLWQDVLVTLALWLPLDFRWMRDVWSWPRHSLAYSMNSLLATAVAVFLFICVRRLEDVGYHCRARKLDGWIGVRNFLFFAPVAIPIGLATGFITFSNRQAPIWELLLSALGILFLIAIPEELLFRGIIQNFVEKTTRKPYLALIVTALIFGAAHLNNGPKADWRYFLLASLAGLFYGNAYQRTGALLAPALVHTLVDTIWRAYFR